MSTIFRKVKAVSDAQDKIMTKDNVLLLKRTLKLTEEAGEISAEVLKLVDFKVSNQSKAEIKDNIKEETIDALIVVFDIINHLGMSEEEVSYLMDAKLEKWKSKHL